MNWNWWLRIGPEPWILEHPIITGVILVGLLIIAIMALLSERREAKGA